MIMGPVEIPAIPVLTAQPSSALHTAISAASPSTAGRVFAHCEAATQGNSKKAEISTAPTVRMPRAMTATVRNSITAPMSRSEMPSEAAYPESKLEYCKGLRKSSRRIESSTAPQSRSNTSRFVIKAAEPKI